MARLQILELPEGSDDDRPPFVLVVDQADEATIESLNRQAAIPDQPMAYHPVAQQIGARAILVFDETIDIPASDTSAYIQQAAQEAGAAIGEAVRGATGPEVMNAQQEHPSVWKHGYHCGILAAKGAARPRWEPTIKPTDA